MKRFLVIVFVLLSALGGTAAGSSDRVRVTVNEQANFTRLRTYTWLAGSPAFDPEIDRRVVAVVNRELASAGLTERGSEPADVLVSYAAIRRTDVDLKGKRSPVTKLWPEYPAGTVVIRLLASRNQRELFCARFTMRLDRELATLNARIDESIAKAFEEYPTRR